MSRFGTLNDLSKLPTLSYRPEVDGLRAIAILLVVVYHADLGFSGGFIGVDVFFVISGYLITSIILKKMTTDTFTFADFIERRVRRIMPAGFAMIFVVMLAGRFLLLPSDFVDLSKAAISQAVFAANIYFYKTVNYFSGASDEKPLLHTWSLAVEEQFYLLFPIALAVLWKQGWLKSQKSLIAVIALGTVLSFALNLANISPNPIATFYLLPMRAWELLLGALVAVVPSPGAGLRSNGRPILASLEWIGLFMVLAAGTLYTSDTRFPGFNALLPCLGAALFIWSSNGESCCGSMWRPKRFLRARWIVFVGLISYSLYLWHWPIFAFTRYFALQEVPLATRVGLVVLSVLVAILSWRVVERPFRKPKGETERAHVFALALICSLALVATGGYIIANGGMRESASEEILSYDAIRAARAQHGVLQSAPLGSVLAEDLPSLGDLKNSRTRLLVWGDSHAHNILPAVEELARERGAFVAAAWYPTTLPALDYVVDVPYSLGGDAPAWAEAVCKYARNKGITDVLLAALWSDHWRHAQASGDGKATVAAALLRTIERLHAEGVRVWLMTEIPKHKADPVKAMMVKTMFGTDISEYLADEMSLAEATQESEAFIRQLTEKGVRLIDVRANLFDKRLMKFRMDENGVLLYSDTNHLTKAGALKTIRSFLPIFQP